MKRPSETLLNEFYELAELKEDTRLGAVKRFLENEKLSDHKSYILERLIQGLSSSRSASRLGFSTLLTLLLKKFHAKISIDEIFKSVDEKLDLTTPEAANNAIARHLVYLSIVSSEAYPKSLQKVVERQLELMEKFPFLKYTIIQSLVDLSVTLKPEEFSKKLYPSIQEKFSKKLSQMEPEEFLMLMGLKDQFPDILSNDSKLVKKSGKFHLKEAHFPILVEKLKKTDNVSRLPVTLAILKIGRENDQLEKIYHEVIEKYATEGDEVKSIDRYLLLSRDLIASEEITPDEIPIIFSEKLVNTMRKYAHRSDPKFKFVQPLIENLLNTTEERFSKPEFPKNIILEILELLDRVEDGNFDTKVGITTKKFTEVLIGLLDEKSLLEFMKTAFVTDSWSIHRFISSFSKLPNKIKTDLLVKTAQFEPKSEGYFNTLCAFIETMIDVRYHHQKFSKVEIKPEDFGILQEVAQKLKFKSEAKNEFSSLVILPIVLRLLSLASPTAEDGILYTKDADEAEQSLNGSMNFEMFIDLLLSILIRKQKIHKALVYYAFYGIHDKIKSKHVKQILEVIGKTDKEIAGEEEDEDMDDDDFEPITEEELKNAKKKQKLDHQNGDDEEDDESEMEDDSDEEESEDDENEASLNPALVGDIKKALGKAALPTNVKEVDDDFDMDDDTLLNLDDALAEAFRKHTATHKKLLKEDGRIFRAKCFDLITIYFTLAPVEKLLPLLPELLELANKWNKSRSPEIPNKISVLAGNLISQKKDHVDEKTILKYLKKIQKLSNDLGNHETRKTAGKFVAFLFHLSTSSDNLAFPSGLKSWLENLLDVYMKSEKSGTNGDLAMALFTRYPDRLVEFLPIFIDHAFNPEVSYQKKGEAIQYASNFNRKDLKHNKDPNIQKSFLKASKSLSKHVNQLMDTLSTIEDKAQKRFLAKVLMFIGNIAQQAPGSYKDTLAKSLPVSTEDELFELLKPLESAIQAEFTGTKLKNFTKRLFERLHGKH